MVEPDEKVVEKLADCIVKKIEPSIKEVVQRTVHEEVVAALKKALRDSEFYKGLSDDVIEGIGKIYHEIFSAKKEIKGDEYLLTVHNNLELIGESQSILDNVFSITEASTLKIMDVIELIQNNLEKAKAVAEQLGNTDKLRAVFREIDRRLMEILTLLGFQDVTGQKIKKLMESLKKVEEIAFEIYISSEVFRRARAEGFERSYEELREEVKKQVELMKKKKTEIVDQNAIDELLESLDL
jgi:chemotaxis protein CheZ